MKRSGIKHGTKRMKRGKRLGHNTARKQQRYERDFGPKAHWIRTLPCAIDARHNARIVASHSKRSRGAGGHSEDTVPLCWTCHEREHSPSRKDLEAAGTGVDLVEVADRLEAQWQKISADADRPERALRRRR